MKKGFTLLEILLVIGSIGILASIVIVAINPAKQIAKGRNLERISEINTIYKALEQYYIANGGYPESIQQMGVEVKEICSTREEVFPGTTNCSGKIDLRYLVPTYLSEIPWDNKGQDSTDTVGTGYVIYGTGYLLAKSEDNTIGLLAKVPENEVYIGVGIEKEELQNLITDIVVSGGTNIGDTLTATVGGGTGYSYQWKRNGNNIDGATNNTYILTGSDAGQSITVDIISIGLVIGRTNSAPVVVGSPTVLISGGTNLGDTLTATASSGTGYGYQWKRDGAEIGGATNSTYVITGGDLGKAITVELKIGSTVINTSIASNIPSSTISIGGASTTVGSTLTASYNSGIGINGSNIIWYRVLSEVETQVGTGDTYIIQLEDVGSEIVAKIVLESIIIASGNGGTAQAPTISSASIDSSFNAGTSFDNLVRTSEIQSDGKILIGGTFSSYQSVSAANIIRLNSDGSRDGSFDMGTGFNNGVTHLVIQSDGKIIVGGDFTNYRGVGANRIVRINSDGTRDSSFNMSTGFNNSVMSLAIQSDGKIIAGGSFTSYRGVGANRIVRINSDGTRDSSFNMSTGFNTGGYVSAINIQDDGKIIVGGEFTSYRGVGANRIVRINSDGTRDSSFNMGTGFDGEIFVIEVQDDGKILIGGRFITYNGSLGRGIVRVNVDGSRDTSFITDMFSLSTDASVYDIEIQSDGKVLLGGNFQTYQTISSNRLVRVNVDGSRDGSFNVGTGFDQFLTYQYVFSLGIQSDGKIVVLGDFAEYNGASVIDIVRLNL